jgi:hypothetical protein
MAEGREQLDSWKAGWDEHRREQRTLGLDATPTQRLAWLEEMIEFAHRAGALPRSDRRNIDESR